MDNFMDNIRSVGKYEYSSNGYIQHRIKFNFLHYLLAVYKEDYKKHKMNTWWLGHIFGLSGLIFSILDIVNSRNLFNGMPIEFQLAIGFFTTLYVFWQSLRAYERWRMDRLENKE